MDNTKHYTKRFDLENKDRKKRRLEPSLDNGGCLYPVGVPLVSFFLPLAGLIFFIVLIDKDPVFAKINGIIGVVVGLWWSGNMVFFMRGFFFILEMFGITLSVV